MHEVRNEYEELAAHITDTQKRLRRRLKMQRYAGWAIRAGVSVGLVTLLVL